MLPNVVMKFLNGPTLSYYVDSNKRKVKRNTRKTLPELHGDMDAYLDSAEISYICDVFEYRLSMDYFITNFSKIQWIEDRPP